MISRKELDKLLTMQALSIKESDYDLFLSQIDSIVGFFDKLQTVDIQIDNLYEDSKRELIWDQDNTFENQEGIISSINHPVVTNSLQISFKKEK